MEQCEHFKLNRGRLNCTVSLQAIFFARDVTYKIPKLKTQNLIHTKRRPQTTLNLRSSETLFHNEDNKQRTLCI